MIGDRDKATGTEKTEGNKQNPKVILIDFDLTLLAGHTGGCGFVFDKFTDEFRVLNDKRRIYVGMDNPDKWGEILQNLHEQGYIIGITSNHGGVQRTSSAKTQTHSHEVDLDGHKGTINFRTNPNHGHIEDGGAPAIMALLDHYWPKRKFLTDPNDIVAMIVDGTEQNLEHANSIISSEEQELDFQKIIRMAGKHPHIKEFLKNHGLENLPTENIILVDDTKANIESAEKMGAKGILANVRTHQHFRELNKLRDSSIEATPLKDLERLKMPVDIGGGYINPMEFDEQFAEDTSDLDLPATPEKKGYDQQITLNFQNPSPREDQTKFPRRGGSAAGQVEKGAKKGLKCNVVNLQPDSNFDHSPQESEVLAKASGATKIYINGHGSKAGDYITGKDANDNVFRWDYKKLAAYIAKNCPNLKESPGADISLVVCYGGIGGPHSFGAKLARELLDVHHIEANIHARRGVVSRHTGGDYHIKVNGKHHVDGSKVIISTVGGKLTTTPFIHSSPIQNKEAFHDYLNREAVEAVMKESEYLEPGMFLFRKGSELNSFACSYVDKDNSIKHIQIKNMQKNGSFDMTDAGGHVVHCNSISEFTEKYKGVLSKPIPRGETPPTNSIDAKMQLSANIFESSEQFLIERAEKERIMTEGFIKTQLEKETNILRGPIDLQVIEMQLKEQEIGTPLVSYDNATGELVCSFKSNDGQVDHYSLSEINYAGKFKSAPYGTDETTVETDFISYAQKQQTAIYSENLQSTAKSMECFKENYGRREANAALNHKPSGSFLIRESSLPGCLVCSIKKDNEILHRLITNIKPDGSFDVKTGAEEYTNFANMGALLRSDTFGVKFDVSDVKFPDASRRPPIATQFASAVQADSTSLGRATMPDTSLDHSAEKKKVNKFGN